MSKTYSQEELDAAVAEALAPLQKSFEELKASQEQTDVETRIANERAELEKRIGEIQAELDSAVLKAAEAQKAHDELVAFLEAEEVAKEQAAELARRTEERLAVVREVASFPEEYIEANSIRWVALSNEDFDALVNDWKEIAAKKETSSEKEDDKVPSETALQTNREAASDKSRSALREVFEMTIQGADFSTL